MYLLYYWYNIINFIVTCDCKIGYLASNMNTITPLQFDFLFMGVIKGNSHDNVFLEFVKMV